MSMQIEAVVYKNPSKGHALTIIKHNSHTILITVSLYDEIDGRVWPLQGFGPNPGLVDFNLPMFDLQLMNIARMYFGQRAPDDGTPACSDEEFSRLLLAVMEFKK